MKALKKAAIAIGRAIETVLGMDFRIPADFAATQYPRLRYGW